MSDLSEGEQIAKMILSRNFIVDGSNLITMPMIKLQRVLGQIEPTCNPEGMTYSEMVNTVVQSIYNYVNQFKTEMYI